MFLPQHAVYHLLIMNIASQTSVMNNNDNNNGKTMFMVLSSWPIVTTRWWPTTRNHREKNEVWANKRKEKITDATWSDKGDGYAVLKQMKTGKDRDTVEWCQKLLQIEPLVIHNSYRCKVTLSRGSSAQLCHLIKAVSWRCGSASALLPAHNILY